jgi:hypothetical protein
MQTFIGREALPGMGSLVCMVSYLQFGPSAPLA